MYTSIEIDFEVYKELTARRDSPEKTENDVIRELLGLEKKQDDANESAKSVESGQPWICKGVQFPHNTKFRADYKGQVYYAEVQNGALVYEGDRYKSPSGVARVITGNSVNGWRFWECKFPGKTRWRSINSLRK